MNQESHDKIIRAIGNLEGNVKTGFKVINKHLEKLNGSVEKHAKWINQEEGAKKERDKSVKKVGAWAGLKSGGVISAIIAVISGIIVFVVNKFFI